MPEEVVLTIGLTKTQAQLLYFQLEQACSDFWNHNNRDDPSDVEALRQLTLIRRQLELSPHVMKIDQVKLMLSKHRKGG